ncbi:DUF421 domain-containing protein [Chryseobacterium sp. WG14]|uniref:DUF421 domain-containing protein n=1 Tax=unclassified Chryseobacterium TaxID=2593645 RepID=UPI00211E827C|nr:MULTISPECIES: YetF domain-containing protein [unclassified Chryseobacterium]MCQ9634279.1 DUF421 domain-containing protein [Chryseobacterium sp. WG23]MCQ9638055.1 DUF421 domain-containing protein [Chryseobacterium sp. WG14]
MDSLRELWGNGTSLNTLQMACRGVTVFVLALILIRISGRRSFGIGSPLDNIIVMLLGAILSRAVVGASPFIPVTITCTAIVLLHRFFSWYKGKSSRFIHLVEGDKIMVFQDGKFIQANMERAQLHKEDIMQELRKRAMTDDLNQVKVIYIERNGEISIIIKQAY